MLSGLCLPRRGLSLVIGSIMGPVVMETLPWGDKVFAEALCLYWFIFIFILICRALSSRSAVPALETEHRDNFVSLFFLN